MKIGRDRPSEVQYVGKRQASLLQGHFSPGPQYLLPSTIGTSGGHTFSSPPKLANKAGKAYDLSSVGRVSPNQAISEGKAAEMRDFWSQSTSIKRAKLVPLSTWHAEARSDNPNNLRDVTAEVNRAPSQRVKRNSLLLRADPPFASPFGRPNAATEDFGLAATSYIGGYGGTTVSFGTPPRSNIQGRSSW
jgi:hypothetical protein